MVATQVRSCRHLACPPSQERRGYTTERRQTGKMPAKKEYSIHEPWKDRSVSACQTASSWGFAICCECMRTELQDEMEETCERNRTEVRRETSEAIDRLDAKSAWCDV